MRKALVAIFCASNEESVSHACMSGHLTNAASALERISKASLKGGGAYGHSGLIVLERERTDKRLIKVKSRKSGGISIWQRKI